MLAANADAQEPAQALAAGVGAYVLWGVLPLYFHLLHQLGVGSAEMVAHRSLWAVFSAFALVLLAGQLTQVAQVLRRPRTMGLLALSTVTILLNWTIYVIAVNSGKVLEASLGYYINPLLNMAVGAVVFRDRLSARGATAIALAAMGVAMQALALGRLPLISLGLAVTFCAYGVIRKKVEADAQTGLFIECLFLTLPGAAFVLWLEASGAGHLRDGAQTALLLFAAGPATIAPLVLFSWAARRLTLSAVGFLQFIAPTLQFIVGIALGEAFTFTRALSFAFIWAGVLIFALGVLRATREKTSTPCVEQACAA